MTHHLTTATIEADPEVPLTRITRDFQATPEQLFAAHTASRVHALWVGPESVGTIIDHWDARTGGSWRFRNTMGDEEFAFHGCFHEVREDRIVQTFTWDEMPDAVALETLVLTDLGGGWTRLTATSLVDSFGAREQMLASGMEVGIHEGYAALDTLLAGGGP